MAHFAIYKHLPPSFCTNFICCKHALLATSFLLSLSAEMVFLLRAILDFRQLATCLKIVFYLLKIFLSSFIRKKTVFSKCLATKYTLAFA